MSDEPTIKKAKYWWAVLYEENMPTNWEDIVGDVVQLPYAYCRHDMDTDSMSEHRKDHVHMILVFPNTTTYKHALSVFKLLGAKAVNTCKACVSIRKCYDYLIHDTETCRKQGKYLYPKECRVEGNNFDIGAYEQLTQEEKYEMLRELTNFLEENAYIEITDFIPNALNHFGGEYWELIVTHNAMFDRLCRSYLRKWERKERIWDKSNTKNTTNTTAEEDEHHSNFCPDCGSLEIRKDGKTAGGKARFRCKDCGKRFI